MGVRLTANSEPIPGYRLLERLGRGGYGEVWKAEAPGGMLKAIKFVYGNLDEATENGKPAEQELKALNRVKSIRHPYILSLERIDVIEGQLVIVMELADRNLFDRFRECQLQGLPGIPREELLRYMEETAEALDLMNNQFQLQHMDIKPQNIFLVFQHVKIADFGLAKDLEGMNATLTGGVTPVYAAPETFEARVTRFCDQYSLAIVYQELLTGERPFHGTTARQLMMQHLQGVPDLSPLPPTDRPVIARALAKDPNQRYPSCTEMVQALIAAGRDAAHALTQPGPGSSAPEQADPSPSSRPVASPVKLPPLKNKPASSSSLTLEKKSTLPNLRLPTPRQEVKRPIVAEKTGPGPLRPALVIGLGQFGLLTLQRWRRGIRERFGTTSLPHLKFLYIDTEADTLQSLRSSSSAVEDDEVIVARLQRSSHYQQPRHDLPPVTDWLPASVLFRIPKQPATQGMRALGRLAFCDHYTSIMAHIRKEIEGCTSESALAQASQQTGLALRTNYPRVYIVTSLLGGTGGGMFLDLAYAVRRLLQSLGYHAPDVHGLVFLPDLGEGAAPIAALANAHAALRELIHFSLPNTQYEALFDRKEGLLVDPEPPFRRCALLSLERLDDASAMREVLGMAAGFLFQELLTTMGRDADQGRGQTTRQVVGLPLQTFGTYRLIWPQRAILELWAKSCCDDILTAWGSRESSHLVEPLQQWIQQQRPALAIDPEILERSLDDALRNSLGTDPQQILASTLAGEDGQLAGSDDDFGIMAQRLEWTLATVGPPKEFETGAGCHWQTLLDAAARHTAIDIRTRLARLLPLLVDQPGWRVAGAEEACRQIQNGLRQVAEYLENDLHHQQGAVRDTYLKCISKIRDLDGATRGSKLKALLRESTRLLHTYALQRYEWLRRASVAGLLKTLATFGAEEARDLRMMRERLETLVQRIRRAKLSSQQNLFGPEMSVFPSSCPNLETAVEYLRQQMTPETWAELEQRLQRRLLTSQPHLLEFFQDACSDSRETAQQLLVEAIRFLESILPPGNIANILLSEPIRDDGSPQEVMKDAYMEAEPRLRVSGCELLLLCVPPGDAGQNLAQMAKSVLGRPDLCVLTGSVEEVVIHREVQSVQPSDLGLLGTIGQRAFQEVSETTGLAPSSRFDVEWISLSTMTTQGAMPIVPGRPPAS